MTSIIRTGMTCAEAGRLGFVAGRWFTEEQHRHALEKYDSNPKMCTCCDAVLSYDKRKNKFCSQSCAAKTNNLGRHRYGKPRKPCLVCGKMAKGCNKHFCSPKCFQEHRQQTKFKKFECDGEMDAKEDGSIRHFLRTYLLNKRGQKCEICGRSEWMGKPIPLVVDHINGEPENHSLDNIRLVCGNCNMQLPTFAGGNRGNGRFVRRMRDRAIRDKLGK